MEQQVQFRKIYAGFVHEIAILTVGIQQARLTHKTETIIGIKNCMKSTNEKEWIEAMNKKSKKVRLMKQDQFRKTKYFGKIDRKSNLKLSQH